VALGQLDGWSDRKRKTRHASFRRVAYRGARFQSYREAARVRDGVLRAARLAGLGLLPILLCALCYYHATGVPFPLTGVAKRYFFAEDGWPWRLKLQAEVIGLTTLLISCGPLVLGLPRLARHTVGKAVLLFIVLFLAALFIQFPDALMWNELRYPVVLVPIMVWALGMALRGAEAQARKQAVRLLRICTVYSVLFLPFCIHTYLHECRFYDGSLHDLAAWCDQNLPAKSKLLIHDAGYVAFATSFRIVDFVGLKTPEAIAINRKYTWVSAGDERAEAVSTIARTTGAEYLVVLANWPYVRSLPEDMRETGWRLDPLRTEGAYYVFRLTAPVE
jgi:hypothetical protein